MALDKLIADQIARFKALESELQAREAGAKDMDRPAAFRRERANGLRETLRSLKADREATVARYDAEIAAREAELAAIEERSDFDLTLDRGSKDGGVAPAPASKLAGDKPARTKRAPSSKRNVKARRSSSAVSTKDKR
jgi:hypothetical protein